MIIVCGFNAWFSSLGWWSQPPTRSGVIPCGLVIKWDGRYPFPTGGFIERGVRPRPNMFPVFTTNCVNRAIKLESIQPNHYRTCFVQEQRSRFDIASTHGMLVPHPHSNLHPFAGPPLAVPQHLSYPLGHFLRLRLHDLQKPHAALWSFPGGHSGRLLSGQLWPALGPEVQR